MSDTPASEKRVGYCVYVNTFCQGPVPVLSDGEGNYIVFETENEAQREIVDDHMIRLRQFLDGERDYEDAITIEDYVMPVTINADGSFVDMNGNRFGPKVE